MPTYNFIERGAPGSGHTGGSCQKTERMWVTFGGWHTIQIQDTMDSSTGASEWYKGTSGLSLLQFLEHHGTARWDEGWPRGLTMSDSGMLLGQKSHSREMKQQQPPASGSTV